MQVYMLRKRDFDNLLARIAADPAHGTHGGSSQALSENDRRIYDEAHRFYNYHVRTWMADVRREEE